MPTREERIEVIDTIHQHLWNLYGRKREPASNKLLLELIGKYIGSDIRTKKKYIQYLLDNDMIEPYKASSKSITHPFNTWIINNPSYEKRTFKEFKKNIDAMTDLIKRMDEREASKQAESENNIEVESNNIENKSNSDEDQTSTHT